MPRSEGEERPPSAGQTHALMRQPASGNLLFSFTKRRGSAASEGSFPQEFPHFSCRECGDRGARPGCPPAHLFLVYLPALTPLCRERRGSSLRQPCSRDHGAAWRARSGGGYPSRVLWGHHPGRRADCRLSVSLSAGPNSYSLLLKIEKKRGIGMGRRHVYCLGRSRSSSSGRVRTGSAWVVPSSNPRRWIVLVADRWGPVLKAHRIAREDRSHRRFLWASRFSFLLRHLRQVQVQPPAM